MTFSPLFSLGNYLDTDVVLPDDEAEFRIKLKDVLKEHARTINRKANNQFEEIELLNGETFPGPNPQSKNEIFRKIINIGALPNASTKIIAHGISGINNNWFFTHIYGTAMEPAGVGNRPFYIPLPNSGPSYQVELMIDNTNINIRTVSNLSGFTKSFIILEYYKG